MKIGVVVEKDQRTFFQPVYEELGRHHQVESFAVRQVRWAFVSGRVNTALLRHDLQSFMQRNDLVFFEWVGELLVRASHLPKRCAVVARLHSYELYYAAPRVAWDQVDAVILVSEAMRRRFLEQQSACRERAHVVYLGVDLQRFRPTLRTFQGCLGMLGSLVPIKRIYEVILALYELRKRGYPLTLHLGGIAPEVGDPRYPVRLRELVAELGLQEYVSFDGYVDAAQWLQGIDILISNSFWESQHVAMLEAMASGRYCLCHAWPGAEELVPAEVLYHSDAELQRLIATYCDATEEDRRAWQARMRAVAEDRFSLELHQQTMRRLVEQVYANR